MPSNSASADFSVFSANAQYMASRLLTPGLSAAAFTLPSLSVTARLNLLAISSGVSAMDIYAPGFSSDLLIFADGSNRLIMRAPCLGM